MGLVVVRCPACRGASRADEAAVGLTVACPRCAAEFVAAEEAELVAPPGAARPPHQAQPQRPPRPRRRPEPPPPPTGSYPDEPAPARESEHDPELGDGRLPVSVLIGLALLPFAIPVLWMIAPAVLGQAPVLSLAAPIALALAASVLCLAVIYTVDWTPATRVKGVLVMVGLAYLTGVGMYFLRKETVDRVRRFFGAEPEWVVFQPDNSFQVRMPPSPRGAGVLQLPHVHVMCHQSTAHGNVVYVVGSGRVQPPPNGPPPAADWYDAAAARVANQAGRLTDRREVDHQGVTGRELVIHRGDTVRVARLFLAHGHAYYLAVEAPGLTADDDDAKAFFDSFVITNGKN